MISGKQTFFFCDLTQTSNHMKITTHPIKTRGGECSSQFRLSAVSGARWNRLRHFSFLEAATEQKYITSARLCLGWFAASIYMVGGFCIGKVVILISTRMLTENVVLRHFMYTYITSHQCSCHCAQTFDLLCSGPGLAKSLPQRVVRTFKWWTFLCEFSLVRMLLTYQTCTASWGWIMMRKFFLRFAMKFWRVS